MDQDINTPVSLHYMVRLLTSLMEGQHQLANEDYSHQLQIEQNLRDTKTLLGQLSLDLDIYGLQFKQAMKGHRFEEVTPTLIPSQVPVVPHDGMPWNIGPLHSPEATTSEEFLTREVLYHMSKGEDTN